MIWWLPLAGAALGAMSNRNRPLQGAMMGGLLGAGAGYAAPAMMGAGSAAAGTGLTGASMAAPTTAGLGTAGTGLGLKASSAGLGLNAAGSTAAANLGASGSGGLLAGLKVAGQYAQPALTGLSAANAAKGLFAEPSAPPAPQMPMNQGTGPQSLVQLSQAGDAQNQQAIMEQMKRRMSNQQLIQQMMGRNYG